VVLVIHLIPDGLLSLSPDYRDIAQTSMSTGGLSPQTSSKRFTKTTYPYTVGLSSRDSRLQSQAVAEPMRIAAVRKYQN